MFRSINQLYLAPYNRAHPFFAIYRFIAWKYIRLFKLTNVSFPVWGNRKIRLHYDNSQSCWIMYNYWVDWEEFNLIRNLLNPDDVVFDIGANIGSYTIWMSKFIGSNGTIHSFEPDESSFNRLKSNVNLNKIHSYVSLNKLAISDSGERRRFTSSKDVENHLTVKGDISGLEIDCTTIDQYVYEHDIKHIKFIKMDIEGFEYFALNGASKTLKDNKVDVIQLEINSRVRNTNSSINQILVLIEQSNYTLCAFNVKTRKFKPAIFSPTRENYFMVNRNFIKFDSNG